MSRLLVTLLTASWLVVIVGQVLALSGGDPSTLPGILIAVSVVGLIATFVLYRRSRSSPRD
ncbi:MAG: hypothetical protein L0G99_09875 [Propionibacteriales bacterium]|nr:hypothetical protein [Propionibacteriales bacterium]